MWKVSVSYFRKERKGKEKIGCDLQCHQTCFLLRYFAAKLYIKIPDMRMSWQHHYAEMAVLLFLFLSRIDSSLKVFVISNLMFMSYFCIFKTMALSWAIPHCFPNWKLRESNWGHNYHFFLSLQEWLEKGGLFIIPSLAIRIFYRRPCFTEELLFLISLNSFRDVDEDCDANWFGVHQVALSNWRKMMTMSNFPWFHI